RRPPRRRPIALARSRRPRDRSRGRGRVMKLRKAILPVLLLVACDGTRAENDKAKPGASAVAPTPAIDVVKVVQKPLDASTHLEGELTPYEAVALYARANGFVQRVAVDRGSKVKSGELLVTISA